MVLNDFIFLIIILIGIALSVLLKKLTIVAAIAGGFFSGCIYLGTGIIGVVIMGSFFIIGVFVTSLKMDAKLKKGFAETNKGQRTARQVFANAGLAAIIGLASWKYPYLNLNAPLLIAACFSSATADTVSSELGIIYGQRFFNIITFKKSEKGNNGVISIEGSFWGIVGSILVSLIYAIPFGISKDILIIIVAGTFGNIIDSILGATLEQNALIKNNTVNFLNTFASAIIAFILYHILTNN